MARVLVIDDSPCARSMTAHVLRGTGLFDAVAEAGDGLEGLRKLAVGGADLVVCDIEMPTCNGARFLALRSRVSDLARVPVVVVTAQHEPNHVAELLELGATDVVRKPYHPEELCARVRLQLRLRAQDERLRAMNRELALMSRTDALTGLENRRSFDGSLAVEVERAHRHGLPLGLVMIDLDHFKRLNDTQGHRAGDAVLRHVGGILRASARRTDLVARYGGEELVALLPHTTAAAAWTFAERVRSEIERAVVPVDGHAARVTASIGIADLDFLGRSGDGAGLVHAADVALYRAKGEGRNRIIVATLDDLADPVQRDGPPTQRIELGTGVSLAMG